MNIIIRTLESGIKKLAKFLNSNFKSKKKIVVRIDTHDIGTVKEFSEVLPALDFMRGFMDRKDGNWTRIEVKLVRGKRDEFI